MDLGPHTGEVHDNLIGLEARRLILAGVGTALLLLAWVLSSPPLSSPDEPAHLIRAVSAAEGEFRGGQPSAAALAQRNLAAATTRVFDVPKRFAILDNAPCFAFKPVSAACSPTSVQISNPATTHVGSYYPLLYVPLGAVALTTPSVDSALYAERALVALVCLALLLGAFALARTSWQRAGWLIAAGPLTLFVASSPSTNGVEVCASIAFVAGGLALPEGRRCAGWVWLSGGLLLVSAKALGPVFGAIDVAAVAVAARASLPAMLRRRRSAALLIVAALANLAWTADVQRTGGVAIASKSTALRLAVMEVHQQVLFFFTDFGWVDTILPHHLARLGLACFLVVLAAGLISSVGVRARIGLVLLTLAAVIMTVLVTYIEVRGGFGFQARYTLALVAVVPVFASFSVTRPLKVVAIPVALVFVVFDVLALDLNGNRYATGSSSIGWFLDRAAWTPPGGWAVVAAATVAGAIAVLLAVLAYPGGDSPAECLEPEGQPVAFAT